MARLIGSIFLLLSSLLIFPAATNDAFLSRTVLTAVHPSGAANFNSSTVELGEPHSFPSSLWWEWTSTFDGGVSVATLATPSPPAALVYTGIWPNLTLISSPAPSTRFAQPPAVSFRAHSGTTYYIAAAGSTNQTLGYVTLQVRPAPPNDDFTAARQINGTNINVGASLRGSTIEPGERVAGTNTVGTIWFKWLPSSPGKFSVQATASGAAVNIAIYQGDSLTNLTRVAFAPQISSGTAQFAATFVDSHYFIALEDVGYQPSTCSLEIRRASSNDDFSERLVLPPEPNVRFTTYMHGATLEPYEPPGASISLWWEWTAPYSGSFSFESSSLDLLPFLELFIGSSLTNLTPVYPDLVFEDLNNISLRATEETTYFLRLSSFVYQNGIQNSGYVTVGIRPGPPNDEFEQATIFQGTNLGTLVQFAGATIQPGEPLPNTYANESIWWSWSPSVSGAYTLTTVSVPDGWSPYPTVAAYRGDSLATLVPITNDFSRSPSFWHKTVRVVSGETIRVQVSGRNSSPNVQLFIRPGPLNDDIQNALVLTNFTITGTTDGASSEEGEPLGQNVWYKWHPPLRGGYSFEISGENHTLFLWKGDSPATLSFVTNSTHDLESVFIDAPATYYLAVDGFGPYADGFHIKILPGPTNDTFQSRILISNINETITANMRGATREPNEPFHDEHMPRTIWYEWTAASTGGFYFESSRIGKSFAVYQGTDLTNLVRLPVQHWTYSTNQGAFRAIAGEKYFIAVGTDFPGEFSFALRPGPLHDDFEHASELFLDTEVQRSSAGATLQPGEPSHEPGAVVWHRFTAPTNGTYAVTASGAAPYVYRGTALENIVLANPASTNLLWPTYPFRAAAGESFYILLHVTADLYTIRITSGAPNDDFANRLPVQSPLTSIWSTFEPGEPTHSTNQFAGSLWWKWTPTKAGPHRIQVKAGHINSLLALYRGTDLTNLNLVTLVENGESDITLLNFTADLGTEYSIALSYLPWNDQPPRLDIHSPPPHDNFQSARPLLLGETITNQFLIGTLEPGELAPPDTETLWYSWTAPSSGSFAFTTGIYAEIALFTGSTLTTLTAIPSVPATGGVAFRATAGTEYKFQVSFRASGEVQAFQPAINHGHPNDDLANAADLSGLFLTWTNTLSGATREEPESEDFSRTIWARWTAPQSGEFRIATHDLYTLRLNFDVFSGTDYSNLESIGTSNSLGTHFFAHAGSTYLLQIANLSPFPDRFSLNLGPPVTNAQPFSATHLVGTNVSVIADNWTASTISTGKLSRVIWWRWTAPANGLVTYRVSTNVSGSVYPYHTRIPTVQSNLHQVFNGFPTSAAISQSNSVIVTKDVSYLFRVDAAPSTNIGFNLVFNEVSANLGSFSGALLGGTNFWAAVPGAFAPGKEGLSIGPVTNGNYGWIELKFVGPGRLRFKTKIQGSGRLNIATAPLQSMHDVPSQISSPHDWIQRSSMSLTYDTNVVRFIFRQTGTLGTPAKAWIDDIQFVPDPPLTPGIQLYRYSADYPLQLNLQIQAGRTTAVETSTNLLNWIHWTNIYSPRTDYGYQLPIPPNDTPQFFRLRLAD